MTKVLCFFVLAGFATGCGRPIEGRQPESPDVGYASWYGRQFHGRKTASGETYDMNQLTAAHRTAPFGTNVQVMNLTNGKSVTVRINDRGPFVKGRILDLSWAAAKAIDLVSTGTSKVRLTFFKEPPVTGTSSNESYFLQVGSFQSQENAKNLIDQLKTEYPQYPSKIETSDSYFRVWVGPFSSAMEANQAGEALGGRGHPTLLLRP